jgi:phosphoglycolate phosphatase
VIHIHRQFDPEAIRLLIFDLDGTLIDSRLDLVHSVNASLRHLGRPELSEELIASYVGDGAPTLIRRVLGSAADDEDLGRRGLEFFLSYYREHKLDHTVVYPGVMDALKIAQAATSVAPRKMAVLSNKPVVPSRAIVDALGLGPFFVAVYGGNSFATKKPDPEGAFALLRETGCSAEETLIVGDSGVDIATGRNAGLWTCGVTYGFAPHTLEAAQPDVVIDHASELVELFGRDSLKDVAASTQESRSR